MRRAIALAARGLGSTSPNPVVGCVILDAAGEHRGRGLAPAGRRPARRGPRTARGGRARPAAAPPGHPRTLQPHRPHRPLCPGAHRGGRRPRRLRRRRPATRRPAAARDARAAGIDVEGGLLADEAAAGNAPGSPPSASAARYVTWKYAATLDGRIAAADGTSRWITSRRVPRRRPPAARRVRRRRRRLRHRPRRRPAPGRPRRRRRHPAAAGRRRHRATAVTAGRPRPRRRGAHPDRRRRGRRHRRHLPEVGRATAARARGGPASTSPRCSPRLHDPRRALRPAGGRPDPGRGLRRRRAAVDRVVGYLAPVLLGAGPAALADAGITTIAQALRLDVTETVGRIGPRSSRRLTATPCPGAAETCSPESSKNWARSPPSRTSPTPPASACAAPSSPRAPGTATRSPSTASA